MTIEFDFILSEVSRLTGLSEDFLMDFYSPEELEKTYQELNKKK